MSKILVCDDDKEIVEAIDIYLSQEGFEVCKAYDGEEALKILKNEDVELLVIDVMMPRLDGIRATLKIREQNNIPIIILSAKSEDADKILGLNVGADDYMTKPFNPLELVARVKSQLRRYTKLGSTPAGGQAVYSTGGLTVNDDLKEVTVDGEPVKLTPIEYNILLFLVKNQGKVFSIDQIYERIWNERKWCGASDIRWKNYRGRAYGTKMVSEKCGEKYVDPGRACVSSGYGGQFSMADVLPGAKERDF